MIFFHTYLLLGLGSCQFEKMSVTRETWHSGKRRGAFNYWFGKFYSSVLFQASTSFASTRTAPSGFPELNWWVWKFCARVSLPWLESLALYNFRRSRWSSAVTCEQEIESSNLFSAELFQRTCCSKIANLEKNHWVKCLRLCRLKYAVSRYQKLQCSLRAWTTR